MTGRIVNPKAGLAKAWAERECRACGRSSAIERHHLLPRSLGGDDVDDNLIPLCSRCHGDFERDHGGRRRLVGRAIRASLTDAEIAYVVGQRGEGWLDRYYPPGTDGTS